MAITAARCCVNLLPPSPSAPDSNSSQKSSSSSMPAAASIGGGLGDDQRRRWSSSNSNSNSWRSRCVLAMTCTTIIGSLEMGNLAGALMVMGNQGYYAAATAAANEDTAATHSLVIQSSGSGSGIGKQEITGRWSEKRSCPAWNSNSNYETIVPENLPRPSARRRWEAVAHHGSSHVAPSVKAAAAPAAAINVNIAPTTTRTNSNCFSM
ncbi:hypothetical protein Dimus_019334 [Dionaea muscipula]